MNQSAHPHPAPGSGGTSGGVGLFITGFILALVGLYMFFDSVYVSTDQGGGLIGRGMRRAMGGGGGGGGGAGGGHMWRTTSMGIVFIPMFVGLIMLFNNARNIVGWIVTWTGVAILAIEILSMISFEMKSKTSHLIIMMVMIAAGLGFMLRSYKDFNKTYGQAPPDDRNEPGPPSTGTGTGSSSANG